MASIGGIAVKPQKKSRRCKVSLYIYILIFGTDTFGISQMSYKIRLYGFLVFVFSEMDTTSHWRTPNADAQMTVLKSVG